MSNVERRGLDHGCLSFLIRLLLRYPLMMFSLHPHVWGILHSSLLTIILLQSVSLLIQHPYNYYVPPSLERFESGWAQSNFSLTLCFWWDPALSLSFPFTVSVPFAMSKGVCLVLHLCLILSHVSSTCSLLWDSELLLRWQGPRRHVLLPRDLFLGCFMLAHLDQTSSRSVVSMTGMWGLFSYIPTFASHLVVLSSMYLLMRRELLDTRQ